MEAAEPRRIALFVDFDNIYLGLREDSVAAADAFATRPDQWLRWIEQGMRRRDDGEDGDTRENRVLIRRCYLNPDSFGKFRPYFTRSGFQVVDCPPLTGRGKNSSDIVMVMDILDALEHQTRFEGFFIMSGDADFTPVLQRLRAHDRRTAALVSGIVAPAYRAACDLLIDEDRFIEDGLRIAEEAAPPRSSQPVPATAAARGLLDRIARRVYEEASTRGSVRATELPQIYRAFPEFTPNSRWLGHHSLLALTKAVVARSPELQLVDADPWYVATAASASAAPQPVANGAGAAPAQPGNGTAALRQRILETLSRHVAASAEPVHMASAAQLVIRECGDQVLDSHWLGRRTFKDLLLSLPDKPFQIDVSPRTPGYLYDPARHVLPEPEPLDDGLSTQPEELAAFIRRVNQLTDVPKLDPAQYQLVFEVTAKELGRAPYDLMSTSRSIRDECLERGETISRQSVAFVLRGLGYVGYRLQQPEPHRPADLAHAFKGNVINLLRQAQAPAGEEDLVLLDRWFMAPADDTDEAAPRVVQLPVGDIVARA